MNDYNLSRTLGCLRLLSEECAAAQCATYRMEYPLEIPQDMTERDIATLVAFMRENNIPLSLLIKADQDSLWLSYLLLQVDESARLALSVIGASGNPLDTLLYLRRMYAEGQPVLSDDDYDVLERLYIEAYPELESIHETTYDSDDLEGTAVAEVTESEQSGVDEVEALSYGAATVSTAERETLGQEKSTSIRPVLSPAGAFEFWCQAPVVPVHFSAKIDGINTKSSIDSEGVRLSLSRARKKGAESLDYTRGLQMALAYKQVNFAAGISKVVGEASVAPEGIVALNKKYAGRNYKTSKSTAMSMLRAPQQFEPEDYRWLTLYAFGCDDLPVEEAYAKLTAAGYTTPHSFVVPGKDIPRTTVEDFNDWLETNVFEPIFKFCEERNIQTDGVVMNLCVPQYTERKDVYSDDNIALKFGPWKSAHYVGRVVNILLEQRRVEISVVLKIEPVVTRDMNTATRVGGLSLAMLVEQEVRIGDLIKFIRKSEASNVYMGKVAEEEEAG